MVWGSPLCSAWGLARSRRSSTTCPLRTGNSGAGWCGRGGRGSATSPNSGSLLLDVGWAWAAVAVAAGWLAGSGVIGRGAAAGAVSLMAATAAYFVMDSLLRDEPLAGYVGEVRYWLLASVALGPLLGVVGASLLRVGVTGLLAGLIVPVGALVQTLFLQPALRSSSRPAAISALVIVSVAAVACIGLVVARFARHRRGVLGMSTDPIRSEN